MKIFDTYVQEHRWTTSRGYAAKSAKDTLQRDAFKVGNALLTAVSLSLDSVYGLDIDNIIIYGLDGEFAKRNFQKPPFAKI